MTRPKPLKVGDRVRYTKNTWGSDPPYTPEGDGTVVSLESYGVDVKFDDWHFPEPYQRNTPVPCQRDELRKLPDRKVST